MRTGVQRISRREFYARGGFANPSLFRRGKSRGWAYYRQH